MKTTTIYILDEFLGPDQTIEDLAYNTLAEGYDEAGFNCVDGSNLVMVRKLFRIPAAHVRDVKLNKERGETVREWEVTIEGDDDDIDELAEIQEMLE